MGISYEIDNKNLEMAKTISAKIEDADLRKRAYAFSTAAFALASYLKELGHDVSYKYSLFKVPAFAQNIELTDLYIGDARIDVRVVWEDGAFFVPKSHKKYSAAPDFYAVVKLNKTLTEIEHLGFVDAYILDESKSVDQYFAYSTKVLSPFDELKGALANVFPKPRIISQHEHDRVSGMTIAFLDSEINESESLFFIKHVLACTECREEFVDVGEFEDIVSQVKNYPELLDDNTLTVLTGGVEQNAFADFENESVVEEEIEEIEPEPPFEPALPDPSFDNVTDGVNMENIIMEAANIMYSETIVAGAATVVAEGVIGEIAGETIVEHIYVQPENVSDDLIDIGDVVDTEEHKEAEENVELTSEVQEEETGETGKTEELEKVSEECKLDEMTEEEAEIIVLEETMDVKIAKSEVEFEAGMEAEMEEITEEVVEETVEETELEEEPEVFVEEVSEELIEEASEEISVEIPAETNEEAFGEASEEEPRMDIEIETEGAAEIEELETEILEEAVEEISLEVEPVEIKEEPRMDSIDRAEKMEIAEETVETVETEEAEEIEELEELKQGEEQEEGETGEGAEETMEKEEEFILSEEEIEELSASDEIEEIKLETLEESEDSAASFEIEDVSIEIDEIVVSQEEEILEEEPESEEQLNEVVEELEADEDEIVTTEEISIEEAPSDEYSRIEILPEGSAEEDEEVNPEIEGLMDDELMGMLSEDNNNQDKQTPKEALYESMLEDEPQEETPIKPVEEKLEKKPEEEHIGALFENADENMELQEGETLLDISEQPAIEGARKMTNKIIMGALVLLLAVGGGVAAWYMKLNKITPQTPEGGTPPSEEKSPFALPGSEAPPKPEEPALSQDINKSMTNVFSEQPAAITITKISWEVSQNLVMDPSFKEYLQISGKNLQINLQNDLAYVTDPTYNPRIRVSFEVAKDNTIKRIQVTESSGSEQIDNVVLQSIKETLKYIKGPDVKDYNSNYNLSVVISF